MSTKEFLNVSLRPEALASRKVMEIWSEGNLFHVFRRWAKTKSDEKIDRLREILKKGVILPLFNSEGKVASDLHIEVKGTSRPYQSVVFLHKFNPNISFLYVPNSPVSMCVFIDKEFPILTADQMGEGWPKLSQDEVYSTEIIPPERLVGLAVSSQVVDKVYQKFQNDLHRLSIPLYTLDGKLFWPR